jgi:hypothetical protein
MCKINSGYHKSRSAQKFLITVCSKNFKQGPADPDQQFNRDCDRDENISAGSEENIPGKTATGQGSA